MPATKPSAGAQRLFKSIREEVRTTWGPFVAQRMGSDLYTALLTSKAFFLFSNLATETIPAGLLQDVHSLIVDHVAEVFA